MRRQWLLVVLVAMIALAGCGGETWEPEDRGITNVTLTEPEEPPTPTGTQSDGRGTLTGGGTPTETAAITPGESYQFGSIGSQTTDPFTVRGGLVVVDPISELDGEFEVWIVGDGGRRQLVETDKRWDGRIALMLPEGEYRLRVETGMPWRATVRQPSFPQGEARSPPIKVDAKDADYVPVALNGSTSLELRGKEDTEYAVRLVTENGRSIPITNGSGSATWEETVDGTGPVIVQIQTDGEWELRVGFG